ncbi:MAG: phosphotransferase [Bacteroidota bacterium]
MTQELPIVPGRGLSTRSATEMRLAFLQAQGIAVDVIAQSQLDISSIQHNIESYIGSTEIPVGIVGPLSFNNNGKSEFVYAPIGTLEGALVASMNRGAKVVSRSGGFQATVAWQKMVRTPMLLLKEARYAQPICDWITQHFDDIKKTAEAYSNHAQLLNIDAQILEHCVHLHFIYTTGDASGQNMTTTCTWHGLLYLVDQLREHLPDCEFEFIIEGNGASDKKVSTHNIEVGRGVRVTAQCDIPRQVIHEVLRTTPERMLAFVRPSQDYAKKMGMVTFNVNVANAIAGIFVATGQDLASIHESSSALMDMQPLGSEIYPEGIRLTLTLPNLVVGTVGGGTHVSKQAQALQIMDCLGSGKIERFAQLIAGFSLALEVSTYAAIMSGEFAKAHEKLGRNKPVSWLLKSEITPEFLQPHLKDWLGNQFIQSLSWKGDAQLENGIITNITGKISNKLIGFLPTTLTVTDSLDGHQTTEKLLIKSKALDTEVIKGLHLIAASIDTSLADLIKLHQQQLEYAGCHLKEPAIYQHLSRQGFVAMPKHYANIIKADREIYLVLQEWITPAHIALQNSENEPHNWTDEQIQLCLSSIEVAHRMLETLPAAKPDLLKPFEPWKALNLYGKLMDILIEECAESDQIEQLQGVKEAMLNFESDYRDLRWPRVPIHNDFNPRNTLVRSSGMPCIYDWELAMIDLPQRDIIEFLSFVLPEDFTRDSFINYLRDHYHQVVKRQGPGCDLPFDDYLSAAEMAVKSYICCRVSFYEVSGIVAKYDFSQRILAVSLRMLQVLELALEAAH